MIKIIEADRVDIREGFIMDKMYMWLGRLIKWGGIQTN